jgi:plastocyanin
MAGRSLPAALVAFALLAAAGSEALASQVTIVPPRGGTPVTLTEAQLAAAQDVDQRSYDVGGSPRTVSGVSLAALIVAADVDPVFSYYEIERSGGEPVRLSRAQGGDLAFEDGPPVVYWDAGAVHFLRPSAGVGDDNAGDSVSAPALTIALRSGKLLEVEANASKVRIEPGDTVTFTASVERAGAGQQLDYSWTLEPGESQKAGATVTHRFERRGRYEVALGVTADGDETGGSDVVSVQVGKPVEKGPERDGGGNNETDGAPDSGPADGESGAGSNGAASSAAATPLAASPTPATPKAPRERRPQTVGLPESSVEGELLSGLASASRRSLGAALRAGRTGTGSAVATGLGVPTVAAGAAISLALLGLGAGAELRSARRAARGPRPL